MHHFCDKSVHTFLLQSNLWLVIEVEQLFSVLKQWKTVSYLKKLWALSRTNHNKWCPSLRLIWSAGTVQTTEDTYTSPTPLPNKFLSTLTGDPLHSRAACTQPCNVNTHSRAHCSPGARLCEQWGHSCVNNGARLCASARLCRGSPVTLRMPRYFVDHFVMFDKRNLIRNVKQKCVWEVNV